MNRIFLGCPPLHVRHWIRDSKLPAGAWTDVVKALENGDIGAGKLNGIKFSSKSIEIGASLKTPIAYYQDGKDSLIADSEWIVCGFNGAVPEYVKYLADDERYFVKATDDSNVERTIKDGDPVYTRTWDDATLDYKYEKAGTVAKQEGEFKYGDTSTDYGTISIKDPYAVPTKLTISLDSGKAVEAAFAGHNMQLWSANMYLDCDAVGSLAAAEAMMNDSNQCTTMAFGRSQNWKTSYVRDFLNGDSKPTGQLWTHASYMGGQSSYTTQHSFIEKVAANSDAMLQAVCSQVNRNWTSGDTIVRTADRFWLPGCDLMCTLFAHSYGGTKAYKDCNTGLCEETEFANHVRPSFVNGSLGPGSNSNCHLRSVYAGVSSFIAQLSNGDAGAYYASNSTSGLSPACTIG